MCSVNYLHCHISQIIVHHKSQVFACLAHPRMGPFIGNVFLGFRPQLLPTQFRWAKTETSGGLFSPNNLPTTVGFLLEPKQLFLHPNLTFYIHVLAHFSQGLALSWECPCFPRKNAITFQFAVCRIWELFCKEFLNLSLNQLIFSCPRSSITIVIFIALQNYISR